MELVYWSVRLSIWRGGNWFKGRVVILARYKFHFIREHENVVQYPSNKISNEDTERIVSNHRDFKFFESDDL